ncbi:hypothetical protein BRD56_05270 [Thermoplasmatales archaeon SW_10_69_26]|nr:MAG: hypothetical protein BRD56_05270 [Thermoplasmatales archaeon SW_10_69_26]
MDIAILSLHVEMWIAVTGSITLAVFSGIFAALGYGVHEIRKVRNLIHERKIEHESLRREIEGELAIRDLEEPPGEPNVEDGGATTVGGDGPPPEGDDSEGP